MIKASQEFVPVFVDTLKDIKTTKRFKEKYGSYPVLRVHNVKGQDIAGRLDGNLVAGQIPAIRVLKQLEYAKMALQRQAMIDQRKGRTQNQRASTEHRAKSENKAEGTTGNGGNAKSKATSKNAATTFSN